MRVLLTIHAFDPSQFRGSERYTYELARVLLNSGHKVHVLHAEESTTSGTENRVVGNIPCTVIKKPLAHGYENVFGEVDRRVETIFEELVNSFLPEVVHVNHLLHLSANIPRISRAMGVPVVFTLHDYWLACARYTLLRDGKTLCDGPAPTKCSACCLNLYTSWPLWKDARPGATSRARRAVKALIHLFVEGPIASWKFRRRAELMARAIEATNLFIAPSQFLADFLIRNGISRKKLVRCGYGMKTDTFRALVRAPRGERLRVGYVGTISHHKGADVLLEAFKDFKDAELYIYGSDDKHILTSYSDVLTQENVHYGGELSEVDKPAAFSRLDALIVPSVWYENSPLVIHEAFLAGIPVLVSDIGGMAELVPDKVCGRRFLAGDSGDLRRIISELCRQPAELDRMRGNIPNIKNMDEHAAELVGYYQRVLTKSDAK